jgi:hypothetical protein
MAMRQLVVDNSVQSQGMALGALIWIKFSPCTCSLHREGNTKFRLSRIEPTIELKYNFGWNGMEWGKVEENKL